MSDFPTPQMARQRYANLVGVNGVVVDKNPLGEARSRDFGGATKREGPIILDMLTKAERDSVWAHYESNKTNSFAFTYASTPGTWKYIAPPKDESVKGGRYNVTISVQEAL